MLKKRILKILCIMVVILLLFSTNVFAKSYHFKAFAANGVMTDSGTLGEGIMNFMVQAMQKLEYNNYYGTNSYHRTSYKQNVLDYIGMTGNNYGFAVFAHGEQTFFTMGDNSQNIYGSDISGTWHLVLMNCCSVHYNNAYASAFKTVGYSHRASIGFYDLVSHYEGYYFWSKFNEMAGSTTLDTIVNAAAEYSGAPAVLWGDGTWNGYAWY